MFLMSVTQFASISRSLSLKSKDVAIKYDDLPTHFVQIQIDLSQIIDNILGISAGMFTLHDVININKHVHLDSLTDFFMIMEVYGNDSDPSFNNEALEDDEDQLSLLRLKSFNRLSHVTASINETIQRFED